MRRHKRQTCQSGRRKGSSGPRVQYRRFFNVSPLAQATVHVTQTIWRGTIDSVTLADIRPNNGADQQGSLSATKDLPEGGPTS